jgi:hypothetical protein
VAAAGAALYGAGAAGVVAALALLAAAGVVVDEFRNRVAGYGVDVAETAAMARAMRTAFLASGCGALALAVVSVWLARGVLRRNEAARVGALVVAGAGLGCALVRTSVTAFGGNVQWSGTGHTDPAFAGDIAQAFADAMPGWFVGLSGGLTDLQSLGYIAVAVLLVLPSSREYFRTRAAWYADQLE